MQSLAGIVKHYDWGSTDAIPALLSQPGDGQPWAEYWLGTHAAGPAVLRDDAGTALDAWLQTHDDALGATERDAFGRQLPYLLKILAADQPLSLQAHPSREQAEAGFADEQARGVPLDDPTRSFADAWPKPEMLVALTDFEALSGFRDPAETLLLFEALGVDDDIVKPVIGPLRYREGAAALAEVFLDCLTMDGTRRAILDEVLAAAVRHVGDDGDVGQFARLAVTLDEYHPGDPSLLAALLLNHVTLAPGQGLHNDAGVLHSYLKGTGIEIMACSDNVLRAGLTTKHVDHAALTRIVDFTPAPPAIVQPVAAGPSVWDYPADDPEFHLWRLGPTPDADPVPLPGAGLGRIVLVIDGHLAVTGDDGDELELVKGQSAFIGAGEPATMTGDAEAFLAASGMT